MSSEQNNLCLAFACSTTSTGNCPIALSEEYTEYDVPVPGDCNECYHHRCCDCMFDGDDLHCPDPEHKIFTQEVMYDN